METTKSLNRYLAIRIQELSVLEFKSISMTLNISIDIVKPVSHSKILTWKPLKPEIDTSVPKFKKT